MSTSPLPAYQPSLSAAHEAVQLVMTNRFNAANAFFASHATDPRCAMLASFMRYLNAISSHSDGEITAALTSIWATEALARRHLSSSRLLQESIEGELIGADTHMLGAMVQFVQQSYIKMLWNVRKSYQAYHHAEESITKAEDAISQAEEDDAAAPISREKLAELKGWMQSDCSRSRTGSTVCPAPSSPLRCVLCPCLR